MKRLFISIFVLFYMLSTVSGKVYIHYCMGEVSDVSILENNSKGCGMCEKDESTKFSCCKDEAHQLKSSSHHILEKTQLKFTSLSKVFYHSAFESFLNKKYFEYFLFRNDIEEFPKIIGDYPCFIKFQNLRI